MGETVGIVGLGAIAKLHVQALEQIEGVEVIGGTDVDPGRTLSYMGQQLPVYTNIDDLLDRSLSAVIVATPTPTYCDIYGKLASRDNQPRRVVIAGIQIHGWWHRREGLRGPGPDEWGD
jgi:prephenate dehydrogenase